MKLDYHLLSVVALLCICQFGFSDTQQIVGSENAANVGRDLDLYFLDDEDSREPFNAHHVSKREAVPSSRKTPKKKKESSPAESLMGSGDSEDSDDTEDSSRVFTPPSDDEDGEDIDGSGDIFSVKPKTTKKPRVSTPPPIRGENSRPSSSTPSSSTTSSTTSTAMPTTTSTTTEEPVTSTAVPTTMRTPSTKRPSLSTTSIPEDDEDSEDDGDYEGSGAGEPAIVGGHINVPRKPDAANKHTTKKPNSGDTSILSPSDYGDMVEEDPISTEDANGEADDDDEDEDDDNFDIEGSLSTPKTFAPTSTIEPSSTTSTTTPPTTTTISPTTTEISTSTAATDIPKSTTTAFAPGADEEGEDEDDDDEDDTDDLENTPTKIKTGLNKNNNNNGVDNTGDDYSNNNNNANNNNGKQPTKNEENSDENDIGHDKDEDNLIPGGTSREVHLSRHKATQRPSTLLGQPGILVAIMGGAVVGLLLAILCVMFVVYRMRKKDEGSFPLGKRTPDDHFSTHRRHYMRPSANKEFYA